MLIVQDIVLYWSILLNTRTLPYNSRFAEGAEKFTLILPLMLVLNIRRWADGSDDRPGFLMMPWLNLDDAKGGRCPLELQKSIKMVRN